MTVRFIRGGCTIALLALAVLAQLPATGQTEQSGDLTEITLILDWLPNTNHAGIYLAQERGYFADEGLEVTIEQPSEGGSEALVAAGAGTFGVSHQEALTYARTAESPVPVVAIAAILQHNTSGFAVPSDRNVESPADFAGLTYGGWGTAYEQAILEVVMQPYDESSETVEEVVIGTLDLIAAWQREIDLAWIFWGWDGVRAEQAGVDLDYFPLADLDPRLDYYTPILIASETTLNERPELVERFLRAVSRGYADTIDEPQAAADALVAAAPEIDQELAEASLAYLAPFFRSDAPRWGEMTRERWAAFSEFMNAQGLLPRPLSVDDAFTSEFLPAN